MGYGASKKDAFSRTPRSSPKKCEYWKIYDVDGYVMNLDVAKCDSVRAAKARLEQQEPQKTPVDRQVLVDSQGGTLGDQQDISTMPNGCCVNLIRLQQQEVNDDTQVEYTVQLRGLPYQATVEDVKKFFAQHSKTVLDDVVSVRLMFKTDGRPSGFAKVAFNSASAATACKNQIHGKWMGTRYVEVFECPRRVKDGSGNLESGWRQRGVETGVPPCTPAKLIAECKELMQEVEQQPMLLSSLGAMLSQGARAAVKESGLGSLKKFLSAYPNDYHIGGSKGSEYVSYKGMEAKTQTMAFAQDSESQSMGVLSAREFDISAPEFDPQACFYGDMNMLDTNSEFQPWPFVSDGTGEFDLANPSWTNPPLWPDDCNLSGAGWDVQQSPLMMDGTTMPMESMSESNESSVAIEEINWEWKSDAYLMPQNHPFTDLHPSSSGGGALVTMGMELGPHLPVVRLRGLPFTVTVKDIHDLFAEHDLLCCMLDSPSAVALLPKRKNDVQAVVQMVSRRDADIAKETLHGKWIGRRYVEVFSYGSSDSQQMQADKQNHPMQAQLNHQQCSLSYQQSIDMNSWGAFQPEMQETDFHIVCTEMQDTDMHNNYALSDDYSTGILCERQINVNVPESFDGCSKMHPSDSPSKIVSQKDTIVDVETCNKDLSALFSRLHKQGTLKVKNTFFDIEDEDSRSKRAVRRLRSV